MIISFPWPNVALTPNAKRRKHWRYYQPIVKKARYETAIIAYGALGCALSATRQALAGEGPIALTITFYPPDKRHRDDDSMIGSFKHARDGLADALCVNDRRFRPAYRFAPPEKPGRIVVEIGA